MLFNSFTFFVFLIIFISGYWFLNRKIRLYLIFSSSLAFYGFWRVEFLSLILLSVLINYFSSLFFEKTQSKSERKIVLLFSLLSNLGLLAFFKYYYFISENINFIFNIIGSEINIPYYNIILPLGISFYTFQSVSYTIDVFNKNIKAEKEFILFSNYVIFFPQLIAGPILRAKEIIWQLSERPKFKIEKMYGGIKRIVFGLFLKVVIADHLAPIVEQCFLVDSKYLSAIDIFTMSYLFGFQIYFDFSAYSHIAIGLAMLMGINFPENFNFPYHSKSPKEFWTRWHITLSSWVRDYVYLPMMNYKNLNNSEGGIGLSIYKNSISFNSIIILLITWMLMGIWHGAHWKFVAWGVSHALIITFYRLFDGMINLSRNRLIAFASWFFTLQLVMLSWIPFRAESSLHAFRLWGRLINNDNWFGLGFKENTYLIAFFITLIYLIYPYVVIAWDGYMKKNVLIKNIIEFICLFFIVTMVLIFFKVINQFIYFQF